MSYPEVNQDLLVNAPTMASWRAFIQGRVGPLLLASRRGFTLRLAAMLGRAELPSREELTGLRPATRGLIVGLIAWIGLVGLVTTLAIVSVEMSAVSLPSWLDSRTSTSPGTTNRTAAAFDSIVQRPLFSRSRQLPVAMVASLPPPPSPPPVVAVDRGITLRGVFINGTQAKAFLISTQNPLGAWIQVGEEIAGWRIVAIEPDQVTLEGHNEKLVVPSSVRGPAR
jgi:hypothetical protein